MNPNPNPNPNPHQMMNMQAGMPGINQNAQNINNPEARQALDQLMTTLRNRNTSNPDQQQQVLNILRSNPQLMSAFIKQRQQASLQTERSKKMLKLMLMSHSPENCIRQQGVSIFEDETE